MQLQSCCFAVLFFCRFPCRRRYLSSQMAPTVTPVLTSQAEVLCYSFLVGGYTNFTLRTFFISTPFKRLVNKQHIGNKSKEGLKHFAAYEVSRRICPMDLFSYFKAKKKNPREKTHITCACNLVPRVLSYLLVLRRESTRTRTLRGTSWREPWEWVSECLLTACHDRQIVDLVQFMERFLRFDTNSSSEIAQKIRSRQVKFAIEQGKDVARIIFVL